MIGLIRNLLLLVITCFVFGCNTPLKDPGPNPALEKYLGTYTWVATNPDANSRKIDMHIRYTRNNMVEISITGFPGPFFGNRDFDANDLALTFDDVMAISGNQLTFKRQAEGTIGGKAQYNASFDVAMEPSPTGVFLKMSILRIDVPGSILLFHYEMTKK